MVWIANQVVRGLAEQVTDYSCFFFILKCKLGVVYMAIWGAKQHLMLVYLFVLRRDINTASAPAQCTAQGGAAAVGQSFAEVNQLIVTLADGASRSYPAVMVRPYSQTRSC